MYSSAAGPLRGIVLNLARPASARAATGAGAVPRLRERDDGRAGFSGVIGDDREAVRVCHVGPVLGERADLITDDDG